MKNIFVSLIILSFITSCRDTCNKKYGNTFENVSFNSITYNTSDAELLLNLNCQTLNELPEIYFQTYEVILDSNSISTDSSSVTKNTISLMFSESKLPQVSKSVEINVNFQFEDRRNYLDCKHPGMNDSYILELKGIINREETNTFSLSSFSWNQYVNMGAI